ncbi:abortive infection family protein [Paenibacillus wynnii]|uniref:abortive infection family protein n=1 Tax=Paenibacillus wynnii TaxID=268407 RepID=UPI00278FB10F|nr:abortive infection family protein [Paenibacillus wynnii]MDQ0193840.1 integrase [Paenibacillus wynnii]
MKVNKVMAKVSQFGENSRQIDINQYRSEIEKDKWDVRNLGIPYNKTTADYYVSFGKIDTPFRSIVKRYVKERLLTYDSITFTTASRDVLGLTPFFRFIVFKHPNWVDLNELNRNDIEEYLIFIKKQPMGGGFLKQNNAMTDESIMRYISTLENFLFFIQRYEWNEAPQKPIRNLIYQEDRPRIKPKDIDDYKYLSDYVWNQVIEKIDTLNSNYRLIILLMEATGFKANEVLTLRLDAVAKKNDGYWIKKDKKGKTPHFVPIDNDDLINGILDHQELIKRLFPGNMNPESLMFLTFEGKAKGRRILRITLYRNLQKFAERCMIRDEEGKIYKFNCNEFRHRFGVNLAKKGLSVQEIHNLIDNVTSLMPVAYCNMAENRTENIVPSDKFINHTFSNNVNVQYIQEAWRKALERRGSDPEGAITIARTLLESVCKFILDEEGIPYDDKFEMHQLYKAVQSALNLSPDNQHEAIFKQILGGCTSVIVGIGSLRNKLSDAHGRSHFTPQPLKRHAQLAVNLAGTMADFLFSTWEDSYK